MGILDKMEQTAQEREKERERKNIEQLFFLLENSEIDGLDEILVQIKDLSQSKIYEKIIKISTIDRRSSGTKKGTFEEGSRVRLLKSARGVLNFGGLPTNLFSSSIISLRDLALVHVYIETLYCIKKGRPNKLNDYRNIYFSRLDEQIVFALDEFDEITLENTPEPSPEYFKNLKKVRWGNKKGYKLYKNLTELMSEIQNQTLSYPNLTEYLKRFSEYKVAEELFIQLLAGCSAIKEGRRKIEIQDVIVAYKTFFKLIQTDVTKYTAIPELVHGIDGHKEHSKSGGYLICEKCGGYYQLQMGESADDFGDDCKCGGHLEYKENLEN